MTKFSARDSQDSSIYSNRFCCGWSYGSYLLVQTKLCAYPTSLKQVGVLTSLKQHKTSKGINDWFFKLAKVSLHPACRCYVLIQSKRFLGFEGKLGTYSQARTSASSRAERLLAKQGMSCENQ